MNKYYFIPFIIIGRGGIDFGGYQTCWSIDDPPSIEELTDLIINHVKKHNPDANIIRISIINIIEISEDMFLKGYSKNNKT